MYRSVSRMIHRQLHSTPEFTTSHVFTFATHAVIICHGNGVVCEQLDPKPRVKRESIRTTGYFSFRDRYAKSLRNHDCRQAVFECVDPQLWIYAGLHGVSNDGQYRGKSRYCYMYLLLLLFAFAFSHFLYAHLDYGRFHRRHITVYICVFSKNLGN